MVPGPDDEQSAHQGPPPPEDRIWRHPSELTPAAESASWRFGPPADPSEPDRSWQNTPRVLALVGATAFVGAAVSLGAVLLARGLGPGSGDSEADVLPAQGFEEGFDAIPTSVGGATERGFRIAEETGGSVVRLTVTTKEGRRAAAGIIIDRDGRIVTSAHVVHGAAQVTVELPNRISRPGNVLGLDETTDLAVVQVDNPPDSVLPAPRGTSRSLTEGETVILVTSTAKSTGVVTQGEVTSGTTRVTREGAILHGVIKTDLPVADDESGAALTNGSGLVIGVATAAPGTGPWGYAIPIELVKVVADSIVELGRVHHVYLGIEGNDIVGDARERLGVDDGARVTRVWDDSPAAEAGLLPDDALVRVDGHRVRTISALVLALQLHRPGETVLLDYVRKGKRHTVTATLAERPE